MNHQRFTVRKSWISEWSGTRRYGGEGGGGTGGAGGRPTQPPDPSCPIASFSYQVPFGSVVNFTDLSTVPNGTANIVSWAWVFFDGINSTSNVQNPTHTFPSSGSWPVTLEVTTDTGKRALYTTTITVPEPGGPVGGPLTGAGNFEIISVVSPPFDNGPGAGPAVTIDDQTTYDGTGTYDQITYELPDGTIIPGTPGGTSPPLPVSCGASTPIIVCVTDSLGQSAKTTEFVNVPPAGPAAGYVITELPNAFRIADSTAQNLFLPRPIVETTITVYPTDDPVSSTTFGEGDLTLQGVDKVTPVYTAVNTTALPRQFTWEIIVRDDIGCTDVETGVWDSPPAVGPTAVFTVDPITELVEGNFRFPINNLSTPGSSPIVCSTIEFPGWMEEWSPGFPNGNVQDNPIVINHGPGNPAFGDTQVSNPYRFPGTYDIILTVKDENGLTDSLTIPVVVPKSEFRPQVDFDINVLGQVGNDFQVEFVDKSTDPNGDPATLVRSIWWTDGQKVRDSNPPIPLMQTDIIVSPPGGPGEAGNPGLPLVKTYPGSLTGPIEYGAAVGFIKHIVEDDEGCLTSALKSFTLPRLEFDPVANVTATVVAQDATTITIQYDWSATDQNGDPTVVDLKLRPLIETTPGVFVPWLDDAGMITALDQAAPGPFTDTFTYTLPPGTPGTTVNAKVIVTATDDTGREGTATAFVTVPVENAVPPIANITAVVTAQDDNTVTFQVTGSATDDGVITQLDIDTEVAVPTPGVFVPATVTGGGPATDTLAGPGPIVSTFTIDRADIVNGIRFNLLATDDAANTATDSVLLNPPVANINGVPISSTPALSCFDIIITPTDADGQNTIVSNTITITADGGLPTPGTGNLATVEDLTGNTLGPVITFAGPGPHTQPMCFDKTTIPPGSQRQYEFKHCVTDETGIETCIMSPIITVMGASLLPPIPSAIIAKVPGTYNTYQVTGTSTDPDGTVVNVDYLVVEKNIPENGRGPSDVFTVDIPLDPPDGVTLPVDRTINLRVTATDNDGLTATADVPFLLENDPLPIVTDDVEYELPPSDANGFYETRRLPAKTMQQMNVRPTAADAVPEANDTDYRHKRALRRYTEKNEFLVYATQQANPVDEFGVIGRQFAVPFYYDSAMPSRYMVISLAACWCTNGSVVLGGWERGGNAARVDDKTGDYNRLNAQQSVDVAFIPPTFNTVITEDLTIDAAGDIDGRGTTTPSLGTYQFLSSATGARRIRHIDLSGQRANLVDGINRIVLEFSDTTLNQHFVMQWHQTAWGGKAGAEFYFQRFGDLPVAPWAAFGALNCEDSAADANGYKYSGFTPLSAENPLKFINEKTVAEDPVSRTSFVPGGSQPSPKGVSTPPQTTLAKYNTGSEAYSVHYLPFVMEARGDGTMLSASDLGPATQQTGTGENLFWGVMGQSQINREHTVADATAGVEATTLSLQFESNRLMTFGDLHSTATVAPPGAVVAQVDANTDALLAPYYS